MLQNVIFILKVWCVVQVRMDVSGELVDVVRELSRVN